MKEVIKVLRQGMVFDELLVLGSKRDLGRILIERGIVVVRIEFASQFCELRIVKQGLQVTPKFWVFGDDFHCAITTRQLVFDRSRNVLCSESVAL